MTALAERPQDDSPDWVLLGLDPPTQLAEHLLPPLKRLGVPFDAAWELALEHVRWPPSAREERDWKAQLAATRVGWQAAYDDEPATRPEYLVGSLVEGLAALSELNMTDA